MVLGFASSIVAFNAFGMLGGPPCEENQCDYYAISGLAKVHRQPSKSSPVIFTFVGAQNILHVKRSLLPTFPKGWLRVEGNYVSEPGVLKRYKGWVALDTVVSEDQFKPIESCWPFSEVEYEVGHYGVRIKAKLDGSFVTDAGEKGHIYYHNGIGLFLDGNKGTLLEILYDHSTRSLSAFGEITKQTLFPAEQLQGCGPEPTVDDAPPTKVKKLISPRKQ